MGSRSKNDVENLPSIQTYENKQPPLHEQDEFTISSEVFTEGDSTYAKLQRFAKRFRIEQRGIERVPETERTDKSLAHVGTVVCPPCRIR